VASAGAAWVVANSETQAVTTRELAFAGEPNAVVGINSNGGVQTQLTLDETGRGMIAIPITEGPNLITPFYLTIEGLGEQEILAYNQAETLASSFVVVRGLPWDPSSFRVGKRLPGGAQLAIIDNNAPSWPVVGPDDNSTTDGWLLPIIAGQEMELSLQVAELTAMLGLDAECCLWPPVALQFGDGPRIPLTLQDNLGTHRARFTLPQVQDGTSVSLIIGCDDFENEQSAAYGQCWVFSGLVKALQPVKVVDGSTGAVVDGADFVVWRLSRTQSGIRPVSWPSGAFGQENPVSTDANGEAFVQLPPGGRYGLTIRQAGYQPLRLGPLSADFFSGGIIELTPAVTATPDREIVYTTSGFQETITRIAPGTTLRLTNAGFGFVAFDELFGLSNTANTRSPSGLLGPGEGYAITFDTEGEVRIVNTENPADELLILVAEPTEEPDDEEPDVTTTTIYLPFTTGP
jgi:hypothetical protein